MHVARNVRVYNEEMLNLCICSVAVRKENEMKRGL
jgi:hypothetical protein